MCCTSRLDHAGQAGWDHLPGGQQAHDWRAAEAAGLLRQAARQPPAAPQPRHGHHSCPPQHAQALPRCRGDAHVHRSALTFSL